MIDILHTMADTVRDWFWSGAHAAEGWALDLIESVSGLTEAEVSLLVSIALSVVFTSIAVVKLLTALVLRYQKSRTPVGIRFREQKHSEFYLFLALGITFGIQAFIIGSLPDMPIDRAVRTGIQVAVVAFAVWALLRGIRLVLALMRQNWGRPGPRIRLPIKREATRDKSHRK